MFQVIFRNGTLARWEDVLPEYSAIMAGVTRGESRFVTFTLMHRLGIIHDAFSDTFVTDSRFTSLLSSPPLLIAGEAWSEEYMSLQLTSRFCSRWFRQAFLTDRCAVLHGHMCCSRFKV